MVMLFIHVFDQPNGFSGMAPLILLILQHKTILKVNNFVQAVDMQFFTG